MAALGDVLDYVKRMNVGDPRAWIGLAEMVWGRQAVEVLDQYTRQRFGKSLEALRKLIGGSRYALGATVPLPGIQVLLGGSGLQATILPEPPVLPHSRAP